MHILKFDTVCAGKLVGKTRLLVVRWLWNILMVKIILQFHTCHYQ